MSHTIAAIATPLMTSAISMIRVSGHEAIQIVDYVFVAKNNKKLTQISANTGVYGKIYNSQQQCIDDVMTFVYRAPKSYTGENMIELTCHGGVEVTRAVLRVLFDAGARLAKPGEFSKRAFLNGKMSLEQAESIMDLIHAKNQTALVLARAQLDGALSNHISQYKQQLVETIAHLSVWADYPEEDIQQIELNHLTNSLLQLKQQMSRLIERFDQSKFIREGVYTVIAGKPNVGKSTLINLLSEEETSIVTDLAGTTRDVVEKNILLDGVTLCLADTAGIHHTDNVVESKGIERTFSRMKQAQLILAVFDCSRPFDEDDQRLMDYIQQHQLTAIAIFHKCDLPSVLEVNSIKKQIPWVVYTSMDDLKTLKKLKEFIYSILSMKDFDLSSGVLSNERQYDGMVQAEKSLKQALDALQGGITFDAVTVMLEETVTPLMEISGERVTDEVLDQVFHRFCVGK